MTKRSKKRSDFERGLPARYGMDKEGHVYDKSNPNKFRVTPCCLAYPTYDGDDDELCCKACWRTVSPEIDREAVL
jgi:hypothetical protein